MTVYNIFEWQEPQWKSLLAKPSALHHALLLMGPSGIGKSAFAEALAARLLCEQVRSPTDFACGQCEACHWFASGNHPDYRKVTLESEDEESGGEEDKPLKGKKAGKTKATQIRIDQIRELENFVFVGSHRHGNRVVLIDPADLVNVSAANSLLKILEEPTVGLYFIIVSSKWRSLLPTLRSRCRQVLFGLPDPKTAAAWLGATGIANPAAELSLAGGAPLAVVARAGTNGGALVENVLEPLAHKNIEPLSLAALWEAQVRGNESLGMVDLVDMLQRWIYDLIRVKMAAAPRFLVGKGAALDEVAKTADLARLSRCYDDLIKIRMVAGHPLNPQLFLEDLASRYATAIAKPRA